MEAKLTLKLNTGSIHRAKRYIQDRRGASLSKLVEVFFNALTKEDNSEEKIPPIVSKLAGVAHKTKNINIKDDYSKYLIQKYK
jgi:hypothetical protein